MLAAIRDTEQEIGKRVECIAIDEGQFVGELFLFTRYLLDAGHDVLVAGLDLDFRAMPFGEMLNLTWLVNAYGGSITECMAYCNCGARALYSQRLIDGKPAPYRQPHQSPRRLLRAPLRRALHPPRPLALDNAIASADGARRGGKLFLTPSGTVPDVNPEIEGAHKQEDEWDRKDLHNHQYFPNQSRWR